MTIRKIAQIGHPVLREQARLVSKEELATAKCQQFIDDLIETMRDANGAGLAANQVHEPIQICVLEVKDNPRYPYKPNIELEVLINPKIEVVGEDTFENYEGCLSVPNLRGVVRRDFRIRLTAIDRHGSFIEKEVAGISAGTYQHEIDHLHGALFVDKVIDPKTFCTWAEFDRYYKKGFIETVKEVESRK